MESIKRISEKLSACSARVLYWTLVVMVAVMTVIVIVQVLLRYILLYSLSWSEEVARYLMIWVSFLAAGLVVWGLIVVTNPFAVLGLEILAALAGLEDDLAVRIVVHHQDAVPLRPGDQAREEPAVRAGTGRVVRVVQEERSGPAAYVLRDLVERRGGRCLQGEADVVQRLWKRRRRQGPAHGGSPAAGARHLRG